MDVCPNSPVFRLPAPFLTFYLEPELEGEFGHGGTSPAPRALSSPRLN